MAREQTADVMGPDSRIEPPPTQELEEFQEEQQRRKGNPLDQPIGPDERGVDPVRGWPHQTRLTQADTGVMSDADVMQPAKGLSDDEVMQQPHQADLIEGLEMFGSPEGRAALAAGAAKWPASFVNGMIDFFKTPGKAMQQGLTDEEQIAFGLNAALMTIGGRGSIPKTVVDAVAPVVKEFDEGVIAPTAERLALTIPRRPDITLVKEDIGPESIKQGVTPIYTIQDQSGSVIAQASISIDGDTATVHNIYAGRNPALAGEGEGAGDIAREQANTLGPGVIREALRQFKEQNPEVEKIVGERVSGARAGGGYNLDEGENIAVRLQQARELKIIGPQEEPPPVDESPAKAAQRAIPAARAPDDKITMTPAGESIDSWEARFQDWVSRIKEPDDVKPFIEKAAQENNNFPEARAGEVSPAHVEVVAQAAGLNPAKVDLGELSSKFNTPDKIRMVKQALDTTLQDFRKAADAVDSEASPDNIGKMLEAQMRRDYVLEYTLGLRAEWGRTGHALRDLLEPLAAEGGKEKIISDLLSSKGRTPKDMVDLARSIRGLDNEDAAAALTNLRGKGPHWLHWAVSQALISGLVTHTYYTGTNFLWMETERVLAPTVQAVIDRMTRNPDPVLFGEVGAAQRAIFTSVPDAWAASKQAFKTGLRVPLPGELELMMKEAKSGKVSEKAMAPYVQGQGVNWGVMRRIASDETLAKVERYGGLPGRGANFQHTFFKNLSFAASLDSQAYHLAAKELGNITPPPKSGFVRFFHGGTDPTTGGPRWTTVDPEYARNFRAPPGKPNEVHYVDIPKGDPTEIAARAWDQMDEQAGTNMVGRYNHIEVPEKWAKELKPYGPAAQSFSDRMAELKANPTDAMTKKAVQDGYSGTFMEELGEKTGAFSRLVRDTPFQWVFFFTHIPMNIARGGVRYAAPYLGKEMRADLLGTNGASKQNLAIAKWTIGAAYMSAFVYKGLMDEATGSYPTDVKEQQRWRLEGRQQNSVRVGDTWWSVERLGPAGILSKLGADIGYIAKNWDHNDKGIGEQISNAMGHLAIAAANAFGTEAGFQSVSNLMDLMNGKRTPSEWAAYQGASFIQPLSLLSQAASITDPDMRQAKTLIDGIKMRLPILRETLLPKRDPLFGGPMPNPGYMTLTRHVPQADPIKVELDSIGYHPAAPSRHIGGVTLTPEQYDRYQATAGPLVHQALSAMVSRPGWSELPPEVRKKSMQATISEMRKRAASAVQMEQPDLVKQGLERRVKQITGRP